ncbi:hypothetical protein [Hydrogenoanaerobacterium sp.]|uniref:hypothetical protein n=1 Tax=Hydrogenoanaerobacterium sp. TaxID=2953763 RepID=UPI00289B8D9C|nr:hypothetical protein [Hydrogenoanaerobacterium sp.]
MNKLFKRIKRAVAQRREHISTANAQKDDDGLPSIPQSIGEVQKLATPTRQYEVSGSTGSAPFGIMPYAEMNLADGISIANTPPTVDASAVNDALCTQCRRYASDISAQEVL